MSKKEEVREFIRKSYADIAKQGSLGSGCCCRSDCCGDSAVDSEKVSINVGYVKEELENVPTEANMGLGCGNPVAIAELKEGETVLDLGCGGGLDCFLSREKVGDTGYVIGVDMTPEMIQLARQNLKGSGYANVEFRLGEIEHLPVADESVDVIISNCVINLSLEKAQVFKEAFRVLKPGGRLSISDIVATAKLPESVKNDLQLMAGCVAGAEHVDTLKNILVKAGFQNIQMAPKDNSKEIITAWSASKKIDDFVASYIIQAEKL